MSSSPNIRRSVDQCVADLNARCRNTLHTGGLKQIVTYQRDKRKSKARMEAVRSQQRSEYLNLKRQGDELLETLDVSMPSSEIRIETQGEGASSLESLRRLITERKEYLEMSQNRKKKVQRYERVTRQSEQLLNFLKANDKSAGDTIVNNPANLVLAHAPPAAETTRQEPTAPAATALSAVTRTEQRPSTSAQETKRDSNGTPNIASRKRKLSGNMAKPSGSDGGGRQEDPKREPDKRKRHENAGCNDKENERFKGLNVSNESIVFQRSTGPAASFMKDCNRFSKTPGGATATQNSNVFNGNMNRIIGFYRIEDNGSNQNRTTLGAHPSSQIWSSMKRKRATFNESWSGTRNEAEEDYTRTKRMGTSNFGALESAMGSRASEQAVGPAAGAWTSKMEYMGARSSKIEALGNKPDDSLWVTLRKMWKKQEKGCPEMRAEYETESLSTVPSVEDQGAGIGPYKMMPRVRPGRPARRRRRDVKTLSARMSDDEGDYPFVPLADPDDPTCPRYGRPFVIPDAQYEVEEALSMDFMNSCCDFIHNG